MEWPDQINGIAVPYDVSLELLLEQIKKHSSKTGPAFIALAAKSSQQSLAALVSAAKGKDADFRRAAVEAIARHSLGYSQAKLICELFQDSDEIVVRSACRTAASLKLDEAHDQVLMLLNNPIPKTREVAVEAINELWHDADFEPVFRIHAQDKNDDVRKQAAWTLRRNVRQEKWTKLFGAWYRDDLPRHRVWACELAGQFGNASALSNLQILSVDQDGHVRDAAKRAINILS